MMPIFLYGSLLHPPLMALVAGVELVALAPRRARLTGRAVHWVSGQGFPLAFDSPGDVLEGQLITPDDKAKARLDFYEAAFGYRLNRIEVEVDGEPVPALVYLPAASHGLQKGAPWSLDDWAQSWGALSLEAAGEVMEAFGHEPPEVVGARFPSIRARADARLRSAASPRGRHRQGPGREAVTVHRRETLWNGFFRGSAYDLSHPRFDGGQSAPLRREVFEAADAVTVLPYDAKRRRILLIEQFRLANFARGDAWPWSVEVTAGRIDPGETPEAAARREAGEEGRITLGPLEKIAAYYPSTGALSEYLIAYAAPAELPDTVIGHAGLAEEGEDIRVFLLDFDEAAALLSSGEAENATLIISLQWLMANRNRL